ncbi:MAG: aspartate/tyrosine/aromatic aminotransferase, partial [bacterium]|nr:aspartate/tyrosine/aromatic aminotransferase [bacterium]
TSKSYLPINGAPEYGAAVREMLFGTDHEIIAGKRAATAQTPGGTGALRVAGDFIKTMFPGAKLWMSDPTWANHANIFRAAGVETKAYPYYDAATHGMDFGAMAAALSEVSGEDFVLLHGCCHNPTGVDPTQEQWRELAAIRDKAGWTPLMDFAYQGFGTGLEEDAAGLRAFCTAGCELLIAGSFSKNFGLYKERVGSLTAVAASEADAGVALSHVKRTIRSNYSNPPAHGGLVVATILGDAELRTQWEGEVQDMRDRINGMRSLFVETLKAKGVDRDFEFIKKQNGMFSFSGLTKDQVATLREKYSIYIVGSGRINVAGMTEANMDALCTAIADVL